MKVCIIGDGLVSLVLAKALVNEGLSVDIFYSKKIQNYNESRTLGISKSNVEYFNNKIMNIDKILWNIKKIKIFSEDLKKNEILNFSNNKEELFSILQNYKLYSLLFNDLKKKKSFKYKKNFKYNNLVKKKYKLIINCDPSHQISKKFFFGKFEKNYNSFAYTTIIDHENFFLNDTAIQVFTNKGPIAFLPISNVKTSIVYSLRNEKNEKDVNLINLIDKFNPNYKINSVGKISKFELKSSNLRKYYKENILAFGDMLHKLHPLAGQCFNMSLRDIRELVQLIDHKLKLGLELDSSICIDFEKKTKSKNYIFSTGIDLIYEFFRLDNKMKNKLLTNSVNFLGKNKTINNFFKKVADSGLQI